MIDAGSASEREANGLSAFVERHETLVVCGIVLLGLAARLAHFVEIEANDPYFYHPAVDPRVYHEWAARIAGGDFLGSGVFFLSPLYPYALAAFYSLAGVSLYAARLAGLVAGSGIPALVYVLGKRTLGATTGALSALVWAVYSMAIFYDGDLLVTSIQTPLNLLFALAWVKASRRFHARDWALAGFLLGLSALARPNVLLLTAFVLPQVALRRGGESRRRALHAVLAFFFAAAAAVLPVTARNLFVGGDCVLVSSQSGANFAIGNGPGATGVFRVPREFPPTRADDPIQQEEAFRKVAESESGRALLSSEVSSFWWRKTLASIAEEPCAWAKLLTVKLGLFFNEYEPGNSGDFETSRAFSRVLSLPLPSFALVAPLSLVGLVLAWPRRRTAFPLYAMVAAYTVSLVCFFALSHYRMPAVPFLVLFAAYAVVRLAEMAFQRRLKALAVASLCLVASICVTRIDLVDEDGGLFIAHYNLGNKYREFGRDKDALAEYEKSIALNPDYISAQYNLALLAERFFAKKERAVEAWKRVRELGKATRDSSYVERAETHLRRLDAHASP